MIFILYISRSGSTLLTDRLMSKFEIYFLPEMDLVNYLVEHVDSKSLIVNSKGAFEDVIENDYKFPDLKMNKEKFNKLLQNHEGDDLGVFLQSLGKEYFNEVNSNNLILGFKGNYLFNFLNISYYLPESKFITITRDVRGIFNSQKRSVVPETGMPFSQNPYRVAKEWNRANSLIEVARKELPNRFLEVQYENLLYQPDKTLEEIGDFYKLPKRSDDFKKPKTPKFFIPQRYHNLHQKVSQITTVR